MVELSVVIAIIALIISVLAGGVKIQKASFIQGVVSDIGNFQSSIENFEQQYSSLPGDMDNAVEYWGTETEDGDGDNRIDYASAGNNEGLRAWQHLALSSIISGGYGGDSSGTQQANPGVNVPSSKRKKTAYYLNYESIGGVNTRNTLVLGGFLAGGRNKSSSLSPDEAKAIDNKMDDALPENGDTRASSGDEAGAPACVTSGRYDLSQEEFACILSFPILP